MEELEKLLTDIERKLWTNEPVVYRNSLIKDAVLVFPETGIITRDIAVDEIRKENAEGRRWAEVRFDDVRALRITEDVALLTYRVSARWEHEENSILELASSLYVKLDGTWKLAFHQQSPLTGEALSYRAA